MSTSDVQKLNQGPTETTRALVPTTAYTFHSSPGSRMVADVEVTPTQVRRPWRSTARTAFQALVALATLLPFVLTDVYSSPDAYPAVVVQVLFVAGVITRLMANPRVEDFLRAFLPFLAAAPDPAKEVRSEQGNVTITGHTAAAIVIGLLLLTAALWAIAVLSVRMGG